MDAAGMAAAVRERRISPVELVEQALARAEVWQPVTNAFSQLHADEALRDARQRAEEAARGHELGPLHGVPVAVKDLYDVAGWETTGCCEAYRGRTAERDAEAVALLRRAGAVIIGKTNQHELAAGATNLISACGPTRNPWDPARITGGSSGGSGAAVAARVVPLALGTDTGGSIRIPGSFCGVSGLKPTHGAVSLKGVMPLAPTLDTAGPMAVTVEDLALGHAVLTGAGDPFVEEAARPAKELRVGTLGGFHATPVHPEVLEAAENATRVFESLGAQVVAITGDPPHGVELWERVAMPQFADAHGHLLETPADIHPRTRSWLEEGIGADADAREEALLAAQEVGAFFLEALAVCDGLLVPATPFAAPLAAKDDVRVGDGVLSVSRGGPSRLTRLVNLAGLPAVAFPAGFPSDGMPVGVQLIGRPGDEATILRLAAAFQGATDHHVPAPRLRAGD
ncbi:MAG: amidase [Acidimicrobiia bacterium]